MEQFVSPVWFSAGIALAGTLIFGYRILPAIYVGSFIVNMLILYGTHPEFKTVVVCAFAALGPTLSAFIGCYGIRRSIHGLFPIDSLSEMGAFLLYGGILGPLAAATIGCNSILIAGYIESHDFLRSWITWWIGDATSIIMITPILLVWHPRMGKIYLNIPQALELALLLGFVFVVAWFSFMLNYPIEYLLTLALIIATFRFGLRGGTLVTFIILGLAILGTIHGKGPFIQDSRVVSLLFLQLYNTVIAITALILGIIIKERNVHLIDLTEAKRRAEAANQAKSAFLTNMSHEFYTPLNHIVGYADLISEEMAGDPDNEGVKKDLQKIKQAATHLQILVGTVLDLSKLEEKKLNLELSRFDVKQVIKEVMAKLQQTNTNNYNQFTLEIAKDVHDMYGDRAKLFRILYNILDNANKFTKQGEIAFTVARETTSVTDNYIFTISDTGQGIVKEDIKKLFSAFKQLDDTSTRKYGGIGLGLAVSKLYLNLMKGEIKVVSEANIGSTFTITLPAILNV